MHVKLKTVLDLPSSHEVTACMVVLGWIQDNSLRFKQFISNSVARLLENTTPQIWSYVNTSDNTTDCASQVLLPSKLIQHGLWWSGPAWLTRDPSEWPQASTGCHITSHEADSEACFTTCVELKLPLIPPYHFSHDFNVWQLGWCVSSTNVVPSVYWLYQVWITYLCCSDFP